MLGQRGVVQPGVVLENLVVNDDRFGGIQVGAVKRGCRGMWAMVSSITRRHLDRPRVSVVRVHGMTITRAPTARPRTKIYHVRNREIPKQILERHLSSRGWKIGSES